MVILLHIYPVSFDAGLSMVIHRRDTVRASIGPFCIPTTYHLGCGAFDKLPYEIIGGFRISTTYVQCILQSSSVLLPSSHMQGPSDARPPSTLSGRESRNTNLIQVDKEHDAVIDCMQSGVAANYQFSNK